MGAEIFYADGWTDRHDEDNSRFSQFFESTQNSTRGLGAVKKGV